MTTPSQNTPAGAGDVQAAAQVLGEAIAEVQRVIVGQEHMVEQLMVSLLAKELPSFAYVRETYLDHGGLPAEPWLAERQRPAHSGPSVGETHS